MPKNILHALLVGRLPGTKECPYSEQRVQIVFGGFFPGRRTYNDDTYFQSKRNTQSCRKVRIKTEVDL